MKGFLIGLILAVLVGPAMAQSLNDQSVLSLDTTFVQRTRTAMIAAAIAVSNDGLTTGINVNRHAQAQAIMNGPDAWKSFFAAAIATQSGVNSLATASGTVALTPMVTTCTNGTCTTTGNVDTQQALVTDAAINTAVSGVYNSFFGQ